ncbi:N-acetyl-gamma-glutamyl-phosphate reductase [Halobacillus salinarum]|uniref:N-acetyl-gamma-glutamyl-phosphate reductase n=1 Tax=Halobacillus salinarum TaxID=2932257 RepID=A0ABY4ERV0_9BACI|nr:N-acetyl-gamma-glutamyl-phosphate reductase [Halobacillus salinarum]UOQ46379.1 N-acetyl-gamma-glutamyl-phosphate reductase [Halobacillus salinarum]
MKAGIVGATGYGGLELIRLLSDHPEVESLTLYSTSDAGKSFENLYSHMNTVITQKLEEINPESMQERLDIVFLATPPGVSRELTPKLAGRGLKVIDLSGDLRLTDPQQYTEWYKQEAASEEVLERAVYGLSEWNQKKIKEADIIANPGCYPTASLLGLGPIIQERLAIPETVVIDAKSGVSGAGKNPNPLTHFGHAQENFQIYKVNQHKHIPEIEQQLKTWNDEMSTVTFSTHLVPMTRGIMATIYLKLSEPQTTEQLLQLYENYYSMHPFVRVRQEGQFPCTKHVYASNYCDIGLTIDSRTNRVTIVSVIDNLMKGAASQAVQNMNLQFGIEETAGLQGLPLYP